MYLNYSGENRSRNSCEIKLNKIVEMKEDIMLKKFK